MKRTFFLAIIVVLATATVQIPGSAVGAAEPERAKSFVKELADRATEIVSAVASPAERREKLRGLFREGFDVKTIGNFALGNARRRASKDEIAAYLAAFEDYIVLTYSSRFGKYAGESLKVTATRPASGSNKTDIFVVSEIVRQNSDPVQIDWRVRDRNGQRSIIDVEIAGISQTLAYKQEFSAVMRDHGNSVSGLIEQLRTKNEKIRAKDDAQAAKSN